MMSQITISETNGRPSTNWWLEAGLSFLRGFSRCYVSFREGILTIFNVLLEVMRTFPVFFPWSNFWVTTKSRHDFTRRRSSDTFWNSLRLVAKYPLAEELSLLKAWIWGSNYSKLGDGSKSFKYVLFSLKPGEMVLIWLICFNWVETTS